MPFPRRQFLQLAASFAAVPAALRVDTRQAMAQAYPTRPVRLVVPFGPGGGTDIVARLIGQWLSERLGQQFVIENRPGAGGNLGIEAVIRSAADGYTLVMAGAPSAINATLYEKLPFNFIRDIAPVAVIVSFPNVLVVNPAVPVKTVPEFIAYAKANPGKLNMSSPGLGSTPHVAGELFKMMAGVDLVHVPYRSVAAGLTDMLGGQVQVTFGTAASTIEYIRSGQLRALAVTTTERSEALPDLPTIADFVPGYEASAWFGICAPKNTPDEVIAKLNTEINASLSDPKLKARIAALGGVAITGTPADFGKLIVEETEKWGKVVRFSGAKAK